MPIAHQRPELLAVTERVGIAVRSRRQPEHGGHGLHDLVIDAPGGGQAVAAALARVPPGKQKVRELSALLRVAAGNLR